MGPSSQFLLCSILAAAFATIAPGVAGAEVYKWLDERGVVNYGDQPPAGKKDVVALDATTSTLSVVPGPSKDELQRELERALEWRVNHLEQEVNEQRVRTAMSPAAPESSAITMATPLYSYPVVFARPLPPRRPHVQDRRDHFAPSFVRPPDHR